MLTRHTNAKFLNEVVNEPSVYEWVKGSIVGYLDLAPVAADLHNYVLMGEHGGVVFIQHQPGLYEAHTQVLPAGRGAWTVKAVQEALHYMFTRTDCLEIFTRVPKGNLGARALVKAIHGKLEFRNANGWTFDHKIVYADMFSLTVQEWSRTAEGLTESGEWFHNKLEQEYRRLGKTAPIHADDPIHDRYVGAAIDMIMGGQTHKALVFYNRWAKMAGYAPILMFSEKPLVIDIQEALLLVRDNDFWVMTTK